MKKPVLLCQTCRPAVVETSCRKHGLTYRRKMVNPRHQTPKDHQLQRLKLRWNFSSGLDKLLEVRSRMSNYTPLSHVDVITYCHTSLPGLTYLVIESPICLNMRVFLSKNKIYVTSKYVYLYVRIMTYPSHILLMWNRYQFLLCIYILY